MTISPALKKRAAQIKVLLMDVDGTMTDGGVILLSQTDGSALEIKKFDAHDGQGLTLAQTAGLRTGCITGRESSALLRRAREMKMEFIYMKQPVKMPAYEEILRKRASPILQSRSSAMIFRTSPCCAAPDLPLQSETPYPRSSMSRTTPPKPSPATEPSAKRLNSFSNPKASGKK